MLVLSIERGKSVNVDDVNVKVLSIGRGKVRLGFTGPRERRILREGLTPRELPAAIPGELREASE